MTVFFERFAAVFILTILLGGGLLIYKASNDRQECLKSVLAQGYPTADIKKICRI